MHPAFALQDLNVESSCKYFEDVRLSVQDDGIVGGGFTGAVAASDGSVVLTGWAGDEGTGYDLLGVKLDANGTLVWRWQVSKPE